MKRVLGVTVLVLAVTVGGVMAGALVVSPLSVTLPWIKSASLAIAVVALIASLVVSLRDWRPSTAMAVSGFVGTSGSSRTPKAVQALAESGAALPEIARRTGLPVDAVSLLLSMAVARRQLQPPTA